MGFEYSAFRVKLEFRVKDTDEEILSQLSKFCDRPAFLQEQLPRMRELIDIGRSHGHLTVTFNFLMKR